MAVPRPPRNWEPEEDAIILELYYSHGAGAVVKQLEELGFSRTENSVLRRGTKLGFWHDNDGQLHAPIPDAIVQLAYHLPWKIE